jgi:transposase InsO family protein
MNAAGPFCRRVFFPQGQWNQVPARAVQAQLRLIFTRWGRPQRLRVDNGTPWGSSGDWPPDLALWLMGLDISLIWNPPRQPQKNGVIERSQGTGKRWTEPSTCTSARQLQRRLDEMDLIQRERYPSVEGQSRWQAFPQLAQGGRPYDEAWEHENWDETLVWTHLAEYRAVRRVDQKGQVSLYNRNHYVGKLYRGQEIYVALDPQDRDWVFSTVQGVQVRRKKAEELGAQRITKLEVTHRR